MRALRSLTLCVVASMAPLVAGCGEQIGSGERARPPESVSGASGPIGMADVPDMGVIPVVVIGSAFGLDRGMLEQAIADEMQRNAAGTARFVPSSLIGESDPRNTRVVMLLNAPPGSEPAAYCTPTPPVGVSGPAQRYGGYRDVELAGALCQGGAGVRAIHTSADGVSSPTDPAFRRMVARAAEALTGPGEATGAYGSSGSR